MKRPSFQFYPGDWQANSNLRRCTHQEKGVWLDVLCLMHDQPEYGVLRWSLKEIAQAVGAKVADLKALHVKGVLKGSDAQLDEPMVYVPRSARKDGEPVTLVPMQAGPIWYSSRMVRDEYVRTIRGESSRFGAGNDDAPKGSPKPPFGDGSSSSSSSSSSKVGANGSAHPTRKTGTRLAADWTLPDEWRDWAVQTLGWDQARAGAVAERFRDFWTAKAGAGGTKLDWLATWRNWCREDAERKPAPPRKNGPPDYLRGLQ